MNFIDKTRLFVRAGDGGDGCLSFRREKYVEFGGPDGGDGGRGGDVWLEASPRLTTLLEVSRHPHVTAKNGGNGKGSNKTGANGAAAVVFVPVGTAVYQDGVLVADLSSPRQRYRAAEGGRGGRGNLSFKSRFNTAPRLYEKGAPGQRAVLDLELKLLADVGLVGLPNAGKSSLISVISAARPKVADYPFTTLVPSLGVVSHKGVSFVAADIPGLIEGAARGKGLGHEFLRHVERTRVLVHLIDPFGFGGKDPVAGIKTIEDELRAFGRRLADKPRILVVNKLDLPAAEQALKKLERRLRSRQFLAISVATGAGISQLLDRVIEELARRPIEPPAPAAAGERQVKIEEGFRVKRLGGGVFELKGRFVERASAMLASEMPEAVGRFQRTLKRIGVDRALRKAGARQGDEVRCGGASFEWSQEPYRELPRLKRRKRTRIGVGGRRKQ